MAPRRILYFTAEEHFLFRTALGGLELEAKFSSDDAGLGAFREYLQGKRGALFAVLADLAGEDFHEEQVPYVRGSDRDAVLARRLAQRYRDTRLAAALSLGTVMAGERRNERVLLSSFTNTQQLAPWVDALEGAGTRLSGVYSVPLLAPALAHALGARQPRVLVVTANRAGLRQCFVENGKLRFARLERMADLAPSALGDFVRTETHRLAQYLITLRALPRDNTALQVIVVAPPGQRATFDAALVSEPRLTFRTLDHAEALKLLKLRRVPPEAQAEALYVQATASKPPREQFASQDDRRRYLLWQLQRGIVGAGAAGFLACALLGGYRWLDVMSLRAQAAEQANTAQAAAQQYERITSTFPVTDTSTENLKSTVVEFRRIAERSAYPERAFAHVSGVLERYPQFELDGLRWSVGQPGESREGAGTPKPAAAAPGAAPGGAQVYAVVEVSGRVNATQRNDYRGITAQVQSFADALASGGYELFRTQLPFDVTSEGTLTGDIGAATESGEAPRFTVTLARRLP